MSVTRSYKNLQVASSATEAASSPIMLLSFVCPIDPPPEAEPTRTIPTMNAEKATQSKGRHNSETASRHRSRR